MKKILTVISLLAGLCISAAAQDIIRTKDGRTIEAKILSVGNASLTYKRFSNLDGPTFTMALNQIDSIQYQNGENDTLSSRTRTYGDLKYKELKKLYDTRQYKSVSGQPYSPLLGGAASFLVPGLGQLLDGEPVRGLFVFLGSGAALAGTLVAYAKHTVDIEDWLQSQGHSITEGDSLNTNDLDYSTYPIGSFGTLFLMLGVNAVYNIWNIFDAVKVAKVKDMYWQDCMGYSAVTVSMDPYFAFTPAPSSGVQPVAGLSLKLNF